MWGRFMAAVSTGFSAGIDTWKNGPVPTEWTVQQQIYAERWMRYDGTLFETLYRDSYYRRDPAIYDNTKLLWKHIEAVVDLYAGMIYQGSLPTDGKPLPDGIPNAIPFDPQAGDDEIDERNGEKGKSRNQLLMTATSELFSAWNWQQQMSLLPMYTAALGDCLTELVDDRERRFVYPQIVWPGYVKEIELDYVGNVRSYTLEYSIQEKRPDGTLDTPYVYRKGVDREAFRFFKNDNPFDYGNGSVIPNPYGFVMATWDRHRIATPGSVRGKSATDGTKQALYQLNSLLSHGFDFQHKAFWVPIMLASSQGKPPAPDTAAPPKTGREQSEMWRYRNVPADGKLLQPAFDLGETLAILKHMQDGILNENPEAAFYHELRQMQQVTGPGANPLMGDVKNRVDLVRAGADPQTVKRFQMAIAMCGFRANDRGPDGWQRDGLALNKRRMVFTRFDLNSFDRGDLDMSILPRPLIYPTESERIAVEQQKASLAAQREQLTTLWGMTESGVPEIEAKAILKERADRYNSVLDAGGFGDDPEEEDGGE